MQSETVSSPSQLLAQNLPQRRPWKQVCVLFERDGGVQVVVFVIGKARLWFGKLSGR